ncbi:MAG TPA: phosphatase PAP2 family protein [Acidobacteriaceae bacterium]|nr:phosphatase PAP2 family protein [Acidobacteriaceae bacterium]
MSFFDHKDPGHPQLNEKSAQQKSHLRLASRFQTHMAIANFALLGVSVIGCDLTNIHIHIASYGSGFFMALLMIALIAIYWKDEDHPTMVMSILVIPWILILIPLMIFPMLIAAHLALPIQDARLARIDSLSGVNVPAIAAWATHHWLGRLINYSYALLAPLLVIAVLLPIAAGRLVEARMFLVSNVVAIALGVTAFCLVPAVGPWYPHQFSPSTSQLLCEHTFLALRAPGSYTYTQTVGVICFPSFHTIWAILSAAALWSFKRLRIPLAVLSMSIILSTMTTGWHYFADVIAGIIIAILSIVCSRFVARNFYLPHCVRVPSQGALMQQEEVAP